MAVVHDDCERRPDRGEVVYTGVDADGELRECPSCSCEVAIDPRCGEVLHVEAR